MKQEEMIIQMHDIVKKAMKEDRKLHGDYDTIFFALQDIKEILDAIFEMEIISDVNFVCFE